MNSTDIIREAYRWQNYKYWYGASGEIATLELANRLKRDYPGVWTDSYYDTAILDIDGHTRVGDCSAMVSACYRLGYHLATSEMLDHFSIWRGTPKTGMITWRTGHCGIFYDGDVLAMRSQALDWGIEQYDPADWEHILYDPNVTYEDGPIPPGPGGRFPLLFLLYKGRRF